MQTNENNILKSDEEQIVEDNDIGYYLGKNVSDVIKFKLLTDHWSPDENYKFPITTNLKKNLNFRLNVFLGLFIQEFVSKVLFVNIVRYLVANLVAKGVIRNLIR